PPRFQRPHPCHACLLTQRQPVAERLRPHFLGEPPRLARRPRRRQYEPLRKPPLRTPRYLCQRPGRRRPLNCLEVPRRACHPRNVNHASLCQARRLDRPRDSWPRLLASLTLPGPRQPPHAHCLTSSPVPFVSSATRLYVFAHAACRPPEPTYR